MDARGYEVLKRALEVRRVDCLITQPGKGEDLEFVEIVPIPHTEGDRVTSVGILNALSEARLTSKGISDISESGLHLSVYKIHEDRSVVLQDIGLLNFLKSLS